MPRLTLAALAATLVLAACDASAPATPTTLDVVRPVSDRVDLFFEPIAWELGERIVADTGSAQLESVDQGGSHDVTLRSVGRRALEVVGLLDGETVFKSPAPNSPLIEAGTTSAGPTSIHWERVCHGNRCATVLEYDYYNLASDMTGTTEWTSPTGTTTTIDRLRFVLEAEPEEVTERLRVSSPEPLRLTAPAPSAQR